MNNRVVYLLNLYDQKKYNEIRDTWISLGGLKLSSKTKVYNADSIFYIQPSDVSDVVGCEGCLVYCVSSYQVNNNFGEINWQELSVDYLDKMVTTDMGIVYPHFKVLLSHEDFISITQPINENYIPFDNNKEETTDIIISDNELNLIMIENGVPFVRIEELEYNTKAQLCELFVKPSIQEYYKWYPIIEQKDFGPVNAGQNFEFELPPMCYSALAQIRKNGGGTGGVSGFTSALAFMREQYVSGGGMAMGGAKPWMAPLRYNKPVPGYTGQHSAYALSMMNRQISASMENYARRVKVQITKDRITGKKVVKGYSVSPGQLEMYLLFYSNDWSDIMFEQLNNVRKLAKSYAMQGIGMLRHLIKSDIPGALDASALTNKAEAYEKEVLEEWKKSPHSYGLSLIRGSG